jgi:hypothetical protein
MCIPLFPVFLESESRFFLQLKRFVDPKIMAVLRKLIRGFAPLALAKFAFIRYHSAF